MSSKTNGGGSARLTVRYLNASKASISSLQQTSSVAGTSYEETRIHVDEAPTNTRFVEVEVRGSPGTSGDEVYVDRVGLVRSRAKIDSTVGNTGSQSSSTEVTIPMSDSDNQGIDLTSNEFTIEHAGQYRMFLDTQHDLGSNDCNIKFQVDTGAGYSTIIDKQYTGNTGDPIEMEAIYVFDVGDKFRFRMLANSTNARVQYGSLEGNQLVQSYL